MDQLVFTDYVQLISFMGFILMLIVNFITIRNAGENKSVTRAKDMSEMRSDISYIKENIEKMQAQFSDVPGRLAAVEESVKSAHRRIDEIKQRRDF